MHEIRYFEEFIFFLQLGPGSMNLTETVSTFVVLVIGWVTVWEASYIGSMHESCVGLQYFSSKTCLSKTDQLSSI